MKVERLTAQSCCKQKQIVFKVDKPLDAAFLSVLISNGFVEAPHFTKAGMLYADNLELIVSGTIGSNRLNVKCKKSDCNDQILNDFERLLINTG